MSDEIKKKIIKGSKNLSRKDAVKELSIFVPTATEKEQDRINRLHSFYKDINGPNFCRMFRVFIHYMNIDGFPEQMISIIMDLYKLEACLSWMEMKATKSLSVVSKNAFMLDTSELVQGGISDNDLIETVALIRTTASQSLDDKLKAAQILSSKHYNNMRNFIQVELPNYVKNLNTCVSKQYLALTRSKISIV